MKVTIGELRQIISETLEEEGLVSEMAATPEPYNRQELAHAASEGHEELVAVAKEWISNIWGLGQSSGEKHIQDYAVLVNQTLGQLLRKAPPFYKP